jgi:hypothetical protein
LTLKTISSGDIKMKAKERHDLKKNELAEGLESLKKFLKEQGTKVLAIALVIIIVLSAISYVNTSNKIARQEAMDELIAIQSGQNPTAKADDVLAIAELTSDKVVAATAWKLYGDMLYNDYMAGENATPEILTKAADAYRTVSTDYPAQKILAASAKISLAAIYENQKNWAQARQIYQSISENKNLAGTGLPESAKNRLATTEILEKAAATAIPTSQPAASQPTK